MKNWQNSLLIDVIVLLLGIALTFAFSPYDVFPLAILAPAGLLLSFMYTTPGKAFWRGFLFGVGFFASGVYWVYISVHVFGEAPYYLAFIITAGLIAILACYIGFTSYLVNKFFPDNNFTKIFCAFPAIWVLIEWVRSWLFTGFAWLFVGYSQTNSPLKGYAPLLSVYGVSLAVLVSSACIVYIMLSLRSKNYRAIYLSLFTFGAIWTIGAGLTHISWTQPVGEPISVSLVQGNIPQSVKWSPEHLQLSLDRYAELSDPLFAKQHNQLIIWPEAAVPMTLQDAASYIDEMDKKVQQNNNTLILGIPVKAPASNDYFNAVVTLGKEKKAYLKRHLVPFGEYTPFASILTGVLSFMNIPMSDLIPGKASQDALILNNLKIGTSICYEITFPELIRTKDEAIDFLLTVTNDAWFGKSSAQAQHLQMAEMRAIELQRPVLMVSNDGITAIIRPDGKIEASAPQRQPFVLNGTVQPTSGLTPWMRYGMDLILMILISMLYVAVRSKIKARIALKNASSNVIQDEV